MRQHRKYFYIAAAFLLVTASVVLVPRLFFPSLEARIAGQLHIPKEYLVLNVPPESGRLPGSIFVAARHFVPLDEIDSSDPRIRPGGSFDTEWDLKDWSGAEGRVAVLQVASELAKSDATRRVRIVLRRARMLEMTLPDLKSRLRSSHAAIMHGSDHLVVVIRSIEAVPEVRVTRNRNASWQAWTAIKERASNVPQAQVETSGQQGNEDGVTFRTAEPVVFAFETGKADYVLNHLGASEPEIRLTPLTAKQFKSLTEEVSK
jgi:hypothetical protein